MFACGTEEGPASGVETFPTDAADLTVEEIITRARVAMSGITSYRTTGEITVSSQEDPEPQTGDFFTEWAAPDRYKYRMEGISDGEYESNELISIDNESYSRDGQNEWRHMSRSSGGEAESDSTPIRSIGDPMSFLDADIFELLGEEDFEGVPAFRLQSTTIVEADPDKVLPSRETITTLLISQTDYQLMTTVEATDLVITVRSTRNDVESQDEEWASYVITRHFHDYNEPATIEAPADIVEMLGGESADGPSRSLPAPIHTPTAVPSQNCSDPGARWPGCGIRTSADVEVMLAVFPDNAKIPIDGDVVVTFPFESSLDIGWNADTYIWHVPSASVVRLCNEQRSQSWKSNSLEATDRLRKVLADDDLMEQIRTHKNEVDGRCM